MPPANATRATLTPEALFEHLRPQPGEQAVVANFWATWCGPCVAEMPELVELHRHFAGLGVRVVAVSIDLPLPVQAETAAEVFDFADELRFDLPVVALDGDLDLVLERYDMPGAVPYTFVVSPDGTIVDRQEGGAGFARFQEMVERAAPGLAQR